MKAFTRTPPRQAPRSRRRQQDSVFTKEFKEEVRAAHQRVFERRGFTVSQLRWL